VRQRAFLWEVSLPGLAQPDEGQKARILRWLCPRAPRPGVGEDLRRAGASEVWIEDGSVSISFRGVVTQRERLRSALDALLAIAAGARKAA
jgi:hypothetical protein